MNNSNILNLKKYLEKKNLLGGSNISNHLNIPEGTTEITKEMVPPSTTSVTIPDSVQSIGHNAFQYTQLTNVTIPERVTTIGNYAFANTPLTNVTIPDSVQTIGYKAFENTQLTNVTIGNSVQRIGYGAFQNTQLTNVTIPTSVRRISDDAFDRRVIITRGEPNVTLASNTAVLPTNNATVPSIDNPNHLNIPEGTIVISQDMVPPSTTSVTIPDSVQSIGHNAFQYTQLTNVTIPERVTIIGDYAFANTPLTNVTIGNSVQRIGYGAFENTQLTNVTIPNSVQTIKRSAFANTPLTNVTIGNSVQSIDSLAFENTQLTNVTIPDSVTSIGIAAFANTRLTNVTIPNSVRTDYAFDNHVIITRREPNVTLASNTTVLPTNNATVPSIDDPNHLVIPEGTIVISQNMVPPSTTSVTIPNSVTTIGNYAFFNTPLTNVTIPNSVQSIGSKAFANTQLTNVTIGNSVQSIDFKAFNNTQLTNVTIPDSVQSIGRGAFMDTPLTNVTIPNSVTRIGNNAFAGTQLNNVTIPNSVQSIGIGAFMNTQLSNVTIPNSVTINNSFDSHVIITRREPNVTLASNTTVLPTNNATVPSIDDPNHLVIPEGTTEITREMVPRSITSVTIPNSVTNIGDFAFDKTPLTNVTIPERVTTIGDYAFANTLLTNVTIPDSVTRIGIGAFDNTQLTNVIIGNSVQSIGIHAFLNTPLTNVTIGNSITTIGDYVFTNTQLTNVTIPDSVQTIGNKAFYNTQLTNVTIPNSVQSIGDNAFANTPLTNVTIGNSVQSIGYGAFQNTQLTNVTIPDSVQTIGTAAFANTSLTNVTIPNNVKINNFAFDSHVIITRVISIDTFLQSLPKIPLTPQGEPIRKTIEINRNNVLNSIFTAKQEFNDDLFKNDVYINFIGESGIDQGGLKREFFTLLGDEIIKKYFFEDEGNYCIIKNEDELGGATIPIDDYYFIGQLFAYCIKVKANINIRLHPVLLHMILNSTYGNPAVDIRNTKGHEILLLINGISEYDTKLNLILDYINKELKYQDRKTLNMDTLQKIGEIMDNYDSTISDRMPYGRYFTILKMSEEEWNFIGNEKSLCLSEAGMLCLLFENMIQIPFEKKGWFIDFIIRAYIYGKTLEETESFIRGFHNVIEPELLRGLSPKDLNILIAGDSTIDIDMFLAGVNFVNVGDKLELIQQIIRGYAEEDSTYLNEFLYWITGKKTLPHNGFTEFGRQLQVKFENVNVHQVESHTCSNFVYGVLSNNLLVDEHLQTSESKLRQAFSKDMLKIYSGCSYNQVGGGNCVTLLKNFI